MIRLRAIEPEDLELVCQIENDEQQMEWGANNVPLSRYTVRQYLVEQKNDIYQDGQVRLIVEADGKAVGICDLCAFEPRHLRAEVGIVILRDHRRRGIAMSALRQLATYAAKLRLRSLYAYVSEENQPAQNLFQSAGYTVSGKLQRWLEGETPAILYQYLL